MFYFVVLLAIADLLYLLYLLVEEEKIYYRREMLYHKNILAKGGIRYEKKD